MVNSFEDIKANCLDKSGSICLKNPDSPHDCERGLCDRLSLSIRERAEILAKEDESHE